ncbi:MAG: FAD-binding protein, partial [Tissierellaceae bacterium]
MDRQDSVLLFKDKDLGQLLYDEPMKNHTSFKIGGPVDLMIIPQNEGQLIDAISLCREHDLDFFIMGNGSNLLVGDGGIRGVVIKISEGLNKIDFPCTKIVCQAGA